jgi:RND family efflux transporter MFP subunit
MCSIFHLGKIKTNFLFGLFLLISFFPFYSSMVNAQNFPPANVNISLAKMQSLAPTAWVSGTVVSKNDAKIGAEVSGRLIAIADIGQIIKQGDKLAELDNSRLKIKQQELQASLNNAVAQYEFQQAELARKKSLISKNLSAKTELDDLIAKSKIAKGNVAIAKAQLADINQQLNYSIIKAPFNGMVMAHLSQQGEIVNSGTAIIRFVQIDQLEASVYMPIDDFQFMKNATTVSVKSSLGKAVVAIKSLVPIAEARSHAMELRLDMSSLNWPIGLTMQAAIINGNTKQLITVPRDALVLRRNGNSIFVVDNENKANEVPVTIEIGADDLVGISGKVNAGDKVIVRGAERLQSGQTVVIKNNNNSLVSGG